MYVSGDTIKGCVDAFINLLKREWISALFILLLVLNWRKNMKIVERVEELMLPICETTGTYLVDVEFEQENSNWYLRIFIDTDEGLTMDECVAATELISAKLDELDFIEEEYMMEVSSPGAERPLKTKEALADAVGFYINVQLDDEVLNTKELQGDLLSFDGSILEMECLFKTRKRKVEIDYENVAKARLAVKF